MDAIVFIDDTTSEVMDAEPVLVYEGETALLEDLRLATCIVSLDFNGNVIDVAPVSKDTTISACSVVQDMQNQGRLTLKINGTNPKRISKKKIIDR